MVFQWSIDMIGWETVRSEPLNWMNLTILGICPVDSSRSIHYKLVRIQTGLIFDDIVQNEALRKSVS